MSDLTPSACESCREFRRGEVEDADWGGVRIHVCDRVPTGDIGAACPCGCVKREPGQLARDRALYGHSVIDGATGARVDPATLRPA